uniref:GTP cyclohydrolase I n=1 Tax=Megasphaera sp. TaxID=2023260 RepID=UPI00402555AB
MEENERAVAAMRQFLEALGLDLQALGMEKTPHRVAQAFADFFSGLKENPDDEGRLPLRLRPMAWSSSGSSASTPCA